GHPSLMGCRTHNSFHCTAGYVLTVGIAGSGTCPGCRRNATITTVLPPDPPTIPVNGMAPANTLTVSTRLACGTILSLLCARAAHSGGGFAVLIGPLPGKARQEPRH